METKKIDDLFELELELEKIQKEFETNLELVEVPETNILVYSENMDDDFSEFDTKSIINTFLSFVENREYQIHICVSYRASDTIVDSIFYDFDLTDFDIGACDIQQVFDVTLSFGYEIQAQDPTKRGIVADKLYYFDDVSMSFVGPFENEFQIFKELFNDFSF